MKELLFSAVAATAALAASSADFGTLSDGRQTHVYRLAGAGGLILDVSDYGGRVVRVYAPGRFGNLADVTLGWNTFSPTSLELWGALKPVGSAVAAFRPLWDLNSLTRYRTHALCFGRQILNHWTIREVLNTKNN